MTTEEDNLRAFESAMRWHGFSPPQRRAAGPGCFDPYQSVRDSDRYRGWCMAREATRDAQCSTPTPPPH